MFQGYFPPTHYYNFVRQYWTILPATHDNLAEWDAMDFIPQTPRSFRIYERYRSEGCNPYLAMRETVRKIMGG